MSSTKKGDGKFSSQKPNISPQSGIKRSPYAKLDMETEYKKPNDSPVKELKEDEYLKHKGIDVSESKRKNGRCEKKKDFLYDKPFFQIPEEKLQPK